MLHRFQGRLRYCHAPPDTDSSEYQALGAAERLLIGDVEVELEIGSRTRLEGEEASRLLRLSAYLAPTELHKLLGRRERQKHRQSGKNGKKTGRGEAGECGPSLTDFDKAVLSSGVGWCR